MKVTICKFFNEHKMERKVRRLISGVTEIYCVDKPTQERLRRSGIPSNIYPDSNPEYRGDDESWEKAYELSDRLRDSNPPTFSGVNFLSFEYSISQYPIVFQLQRFLQTKECDTLILVLNKPYCYWLFDINTGNMRTLRYGMNFRLPISYKHLILAPITVIMGLIGMFKQGISKQGGDMVLFVVTSALYLRPALAIGTQCGKEGMRTYFATCDWHLSSMLNQVPHAIKLPIPRHLISVAKLIFTIRRHIPHGELCYDLLRGRVPWLCYNAVSNIVFLEKLIKGVNPSLICLMPDSSFLQLMAAGLAKKYKIPTLAASAAMEIKHPSFMRHLHADKIAVMGDRMRDMYANTNKLM